MNKIQKLVSTGIIILAHAAHGQPIVSEEFSGYQRKNVPSLFKKDIFEQIQIFNEKYKINIPTNTRRIIKISKNFLSICTFGDINISSSDPKVISVSVIQQEILASAHVSGIEHNNTAVISAQCGRYYDSISVIAGGGI